MGRLWTGATVVIADADKGCMIKFAQRHRMILGWIAVVISTLMACFWAFWGIIENFHEGWYHHSLWMNLGLMLVQYLLPMLLFVAAAMISIAWPRVGGTIHVAAGLWAAWFFSRASALTVSLFFVAPLLLMGILYWLGRTEPKRWALMMILGFPAITLVACGVEQALRIAGRSTGSASSAQHLSDNGVDLIWAPAGPGWPDHGMPWDEAMRQCQYLTEDGLTLANTPQGIWRLPTVQEVVASLRRHDRNCGGTWDEVHGQARYQTMPDKESPLWDVYSPVIYWWTATEASAEKSYLVAYDGQAWTRPKRAKCGYLAFRAVKGGKEK